MKRRLNVGLVALLLAAAMVVPACAGGSTVTKKLDYANFTRIEAEDTFNVEVTQGSAFSVSVTVSKDLVDYLAVSQEGDMVRIKLDPHHPFTDFTLKKFTVRARVTMPAVSAVTLSGASSGSLSGFKSANKFALVLSGASSTKLDKFETGTARFDISGASKVTGNIKATQVEFVVSGASQVELWGSADNLTFTASGASRLELSRFPVATADARVSGASQGSIDAHSTVGVTLTDASRLYFRSNPSFYRQEISGASTIKHQ